MSRPFSQRPDVVTARRRSLGSGGDGLKAVRLPVLGQAMSLVGAKGRAAAALGDQVISSVTNFVVLFAALHGLRIGALGVFTLPYTTALLPIFAWFIFLPRREEPKTDHAPPPASVCAGQTSSPARPSRR